MRHSLAWAGTFLPVVVLLTAGCTGTPAAEQSAASPPARSSWSTPAGSSPSSAPDGCRQSPVLVGGLPGWTQSAAPPDRTPYVMSHEGNLVGVLFGHPLSAPPRPGGPSNKILWIAREPRGGKDLQLTLRPIDGSGPAVTVSQPANSSPGEIYPSIVDVPTAGCWAVVAEWNGHRAALELTYT